MDTSRCHILEQTLKAFFRDPTHETRHHPPRGPHAPLPYRDPASPLQRPHTKLLGDPVPPSSSRGPRFPSSLQRPHTKLLGDPVCLLLLTGTPLPLFSSETPHQAPRGPRAPPPPHRTLHPSSSRGPCMPCSHETLHHPMGPCAPPPSHGDPAPSPRAEGSPRR